MTTYCSLFSCLIFLLTILSAPGCGDVNPEEKDEDLSLDGEYVSETFRPQMMNVKIGALENGILNTGATLSVYVTCTNVYGSGSITDWYLGSSGSPVTVNSGTGTVQIPVANNINCTLTLASFNDGTNNFNPSGTSAAATINATSSTVTWAASPTTPEQYSHSTTNYYFLAVGGSTSYSTSASVSLNFYYTNDPATATAATSTTLNIDTVTLTATNVPAPTGGMTLYTFNSTYTLVSTVVAPGSPSGGTLTCKYTSTSLASPTWTSVNTAFASATACPANMYDGTGASSPQGNWTSIYNGSTTYYVIWGYTVGGSTSYLLFTVL